MAEDRAERREAGASGVTPSRSRPAPTRGILRAAPPTGQKHRPWWHHVQTHVHDALGDAPLGPSTQKFLRRLGSTVADVWHLNDAALSDRLRRVHFRTEDLVHTYPFSKALAPEVEAHTRASVELEALERQERLRTRAWTAQELQSLYRVCCRAREEVPSAAVLDALARACTPRRRTLDVHGHPLRTHLVPLADMLATPTGLDGLVLNACALDDAGARALAFALYASQSLASLSLASNPDIQTPGWHAIGVLLSSSPALRHLDVSDNSLSKSMAKALLASCANSHLETLRMDACALRHGALSAVVQAVRSSQIRHLSVRRNHADPETLCQVLYADDIQPAHPDADDVPMDDLYMDDRTQVVLSTLAGHPEPDSGLQERQRRRDELTHRIATFQRSLVHSNSSMLWTLDARANGWGDDAVAHLAPALRVNTSLKVLALNDNLIGPAGLAALAHALSYNTTLETLDLSGNACCGPDLVGILALRRCLAVHPRLKKVVLARTHMAADGALALAECFPEAEQLVHLDVALNNLGLVGVLALDAGLRHHHGLRCIDVAWAPEFDSDDMWAAAQSIYRQCATHTQHARARASRGTHFQDPLAKSVLARALQARGVPQRPASPPLWPARHASPAPTSATGARPTEHDERHERADADASQARREADASPDTRRQDALDDDAAPHTERHDAQDATSPDPQRSDEPALPTPPPRTAHSDPAPDPPADQVTPENDTLDDVPPSLEAALQEAVASTML